MAKKYLDALATLMARATSGTVTRVRLEQKHFFSGAAVYANGRICISLTPVGFALKLPEESRNALIEQTGAKPLRYFPKGPIKKDYVVLPKAILSDTKSLRRWVKLSIQYAATQPKPPARKRNR